MLKRTKPQPFSRYDSLRTTILLLGSIGLLVPVTTIADDRIDPTLGRPDPKQKLLWYDIRDLGVEGQGWTNTKAPFDRLPASAEKQVRPPVWSLSRHSAGLSVRFRTSAPKLAARWTLTSASLAMPHMPATGVSGLDLYVRPAGTGQVTKKAHRWQWLATGRPSKFPTNEVVLVDNLSSTDREYSLYLPLYNGVQSVEIGIPSEHPLYKLPRAAGKRKPIIFYGTSITQGGCASRTGMVHTAILSRRLDEPVINLGFSGNGRMEQPLADLMASIAATIYVIDCLPNMNGKDVAARTEPLVKTLRKARPDTPILLVEDRSYSNAFLVKSAQDRNQQNRQALQAAYQKLTAAGVRKLYYLPGKHLLGSDNLGTVDGSHPTDLGFMRMADVFEPVLRKILTESRSNR